MSKHNNASEIDDSLSSDHHQLDQLTETPQQLKEQITLLQKRNSELEEALKAALKKQKHLELHIKQLLNQQQQQRKSEQQQVQNNENNSSNSNNNNLHVQAKKDQLQIKCNFEITRASASLIDIALPAAITSASQVRFHLVSDIHLEMKQQLQNLHKVVEPPVASLQDYDAENNATSTTFHVLLLLGDIGNPRLSNYEQFLTIQAQRFSLVLVLLGNHEFYGSSIDETRQHVSNQVLAALPNVLLLDNTVVNFNTKNSATQLIKIVGSTLWSEIEAEQASHVKEQLNDYKMIDGFTLAKCQELHTIAKQFVFKELAEFQTSNAANNGSKLLILTHHAPVYEKCGNPKYDTSPIKSAFANKFDKQIAALDFATVFCFGHTHWQCDFMLGKARILSNQTGYAAKKSRAKEFTLQ